MGEVAFVCPGEQRRLIRADVSVDVAKEEGLKNGWMSFMVRYVTAFGRERGG